MATAPSPLDILLARPDVRPNPGASDADITATERRLGLTLPEPVRELYRRADGAALGPRARILPLAETEEFATYLAAVECHGPFGYFPLTDANDSNPVCVACRTPLAGHLVHVFHDDVPKLLFRSPDEFYPAVGSLLDAGESFIEIPSPFDGPERTDDDRRVGRELLGLGDRLGADTEIQFAYDLFAVTLLGPDDVPDIVRLLAHPDGPRGGAEYRLTAIGTPEAMAAVEAYRRSVAAFCRRVVAELRAAGIEAALEEQLGRLVVVFGPPRSYLNHATFYRLRDEPDGMARIVGRVRELLALDANR